MQAFLWRHLLPAEDLPLYVYNNGYKPPAERIRPEIRDEDIKQLFIKAIKGSI